MKNPASFFVLILSLTLSFSSANELACQISEDCPNLQNCHQNICVQKELFPITPEEGFGTFLAVIINVLMTLGGVGAGAAYAPYLQFIFKVPLQKAFAMCSACVFGGGVGNLLSIITLKDPVTNRYSINYDINLIVLPALMIGVSIGSIVSRALAPLLVKIVLLFVLRLFIH